MYIYNNNCCKVKGSFVSFFFKSSKLITDLMCSGKSSRVQVLQHKMLFRRIVVLVRGITNKFLELERSVCLGLN